MRCELERPSVEHAPGKPGTTSRGADRTAPSASPAPCFPLALQALPASPVPIGMRVNLYPFFGIESSIHAHCWMVRIAKSFTDKPYLPKTVHDHGRHPRRGRHPGEREANRGEAQGKGEAQGQSETQEQREAREQGEALGG